jgi:hypothetical protein
VNIVDPKRRYARFLLIYAVLFLLAALPFPGVAFSALALGYVGVIAVGRAWVRNENTRTAIAKKLQEGDPDEMPDLRWFALVSACQLVILFPLLFRQAQHAFSLFVVHGDVGILSWFWFTLDKTYLKALPDWTVLYKVHISSIDLASPWGQHLVLFTRLTFDLLLIQGLKRLYDIRKTVQDGVAAVKKDVEMVALLGKRAVPALLAKLRDRDDHVRGRAAEALGGLDDVELARALPLFEETLAKYKAQLGPDHPHTLTSMNNLASAYQAAGQSDRALPLLEAAARGIEKRRFQHEYARGILANTIRAYEQAKQFAKAQKWRQKWLAHVKAAAGPESPPPTLTNWPNWA